LFCWLVGGGVAFVVDEEEGKVDGSGAGGWCSFGSIKRIPSTSARASIRFQI
jgi:hypothetical protein